MPQPRGAGSNFEPVPAARPAPSPVVTPLPQVTPAGFTSGQDNGDGVGQSGRNVWAPPAPAAAQQEQPQPYESPQDATVDDTNQGSTGANEEAKNAALWEAMMGGSGYGGGGEAISNPVQPTPVPLMDPRDIGQNDSRHQEFHSPHAANVTPTHEYPEEQAAAGFAGGNGNGDSDSDVDPGLAAALTDGLVSQQQGAQGMAATAGEYTDGDGQHAGEGGAYNNGQGDGYGEYGYGAGNGEGYGYGYENGEGYGDYDAAGYAGGYGYGDGYEDGYGNGFGNGYDGAYAGGADYGTQDTGTGYTVNGEGGWEVAGGSKAEDATAGRVNPLAGEDSGEEAERRKVVRSLHHHDPEKLECRDWMQHPWVKPSLERTTQHRNRYV